MKRIILLFTISLWIFSPNNFYSQLKDNTTRIGTFDSRCVAMAYGRTQFKTEIMELKRQMAKAIEEKDSSKINELSVLGPTKQVIMHQQGFSTGSVINIMEKIKDKLPEIAKKNDIVMIISKWEIAYNNTSIDQIDITDDLVKLFEPDNETMKIIEQVKAIDPVPIEQISIDPTHKK